MTPGWELSTHIGQLTFRKADAQAAKQTFNGTRKRCGATKAVALLMSWVARIELFSIRTQGETLVDCNT